MDVTDINETLPMVAKHSQEFCPNDGRARSGALLSGAELDLLVGFDVLTRYSSEILEMTDKVFALMRVPWVIASSGGLL
jgi:hypothetical protein